MSLGPANGFAPQTSIRLHMVWRVSTSDMASMAPRDEGDRGSCTNTAEEGLAGYLDESLELEEGRRIREREGALAGPRLEGRRADLVREDAQVAGLVTNFLDAVVRIIQESGGLKGAGVERFRSLLVEAKDDPFRGEKILPHHVVCSGRAVDGGIDGVGDVGGKGGLGAPVVAIKERLAWNGAVILVSEPLGTWITTISAGGHAKSLAGEKGQCDNSDHC